MKINETKLINLISESVRNVLLENENNKPYNIVVYKKQNLEDYNYIKEHKDFIYSFLNIGYIAAGLGNYCGCTSSKSLLKNFNVIKIAYYNATIIALSVYTGYQDGKKCVGITATTDEKYRDLGKNAVIDFVKDDINLYYDFYWSECSGALEHLYKKYGGIMIPNDYIELFIGNKFETKLKDGYHFSVRFKSSFPDEDDTVITKCIFGFNNRRTYELVKERLNSDIRKRIDFIMNSVEKSNNIYKRDELYNLFRLKNSNFNLIFNEYYKLIEFNNILTYQFVDKEEKQINNYNINEIEKMTAQEIVNNCQELFGFFKNYNIDNFMYSNILIKLYIEKIRVLIGRIL